MNHMKLPKVSFHDLRETEEIPTALTQRCETDLAEFITRAQPIINAVREEGDSALLEFGIRFDHVKTTNFNLKVSESEFDAAFKLVEDDVVKAIKFSIENIKRFHKTQMPRPMWWQEMSPGVYAGERHTPIQSIACYVPRGKGSFPSVVMMTTIPAIVAGVPRPIIITPPGPDGHVDAATLVAARLIGIDEVYKCGGAQGVAAVAYGTETVPKCRKIVGPGSPWTVAAKRLLRDEIDPGIPAGPSESIILADKTAHGKLAALDLLVESEHGPDSSAYLVTDDEQVARNALAAIPEYWKVMKQERATFSQTVLCGAHGGIILTQDFHSAIAFVNSYAPEHLEILTQNPMAVLGRIKNAGEVLLGRHTPVTLGNFTLGTNAVLPTNGAAHVSSPLSVHDYMKTTAVGYVTTNSGYHELADPARILATYEGFDAHARAVDASRDEI